jgi:hypothetical protein
MNCVIRWNGGICFFSDTWLGDRRIAAQLDRLAAIAARGVRIEFTEDQFAADVTVDRSLREPQQLNYFAA